jgi:hypothetical protein
MLSHKKIIFYELNEVPLRILDWFVSRQPKSALADLLRHGRTYQTYTEDAGHLSPWITWPTLHRGVTNQHHEIYDFGQNLKHVNNVYPPIWTILAEAGRRVGIFGSLHSYPVPTNLDNYAFYVPDTFAAGPECFPRKFTRFQEFNLAMVDGSPRNVARSIPLREAVRFLAAAPRLGLRARTAIDLGKQVLSEQLKRERVVRRRTSQVQIAFDFFLEELRRTRPDAAFFFTNHVASSMHRYWPAIFPDDYRESRWPDAWRTMYKDEIPYTMTQADRQVGDLIRFVRAHDDYALVVASSMGQAAVEGEGLVRTQLYIGEMDTFMRRLGLAPDEWSRRRNMLPYYTVAVAESAIGRFRDAVGGLTVNGGPISVREHAAGIVTIGLGHLNLDDRTLDVRLYGHPIPLPELGLVNQRIQDESGANAYHIPNGSMIVFDPKEPAGAGGTERPVISTVEIAPSVLRNFGIDIPGYMERPGAL